MELEIILRETVIEGGEKAVIFSQWLRMTELVERVLQKNGIGYVHLNGSIPSKQRKGLMARFREDPECMVFLSTDAGGVGLNLQSGSVVINMDIPWNPAVLEQRIGRIHRLGQRKTVRVINFLTSASIEERLLDLLKFNKSLFAGVLDKEGENVVMVGESQLKRFMRSVEAATADLEEESGQINKKPHEKMAANEKESGEKGKTVVPSGKGCRLTLVEVLSSGARLLSNLARMVSDPGLKGQTLDKQLGSFIRSDEKTGRMSLNIPLPEPEVLNGILSSLAALIFKDEDSKEI